MKHSEFTRAVETEFGADYGRALVRDVVLSEFDCPGAEALTRGVPPREVWRALCGAMDVPEHRVHGAGRPEPRKS
ncbi:MAG: hypothetical protein RIS25_615 [Actinomycetota bacterium]